MYNGKFKRMKKRIFLSLSALRFLLKEACVFSDVASRYLHHFLPRRGFQVRSLYGLPGVSSRWS